MSALARMGKAEADGLAAAAIERGAMQHVDELAGLVLELDECGELRYVLEVGVGEGGTLWLWSQLALPNASLAAIDSGLERHDLERCYSYRRAEQRMIVWPSDSQDAETVERVRAYCGCRLDLLYIDADHSYEGVAADFRNYSPLVRPGGVIVLHDTALEGPGELLRELAGAAGDGLGVIARELLRAPDPADPQRERAGVPGSEWGGFGIITMVS